MAAALRGLGHTVHPDVGSGGYRVDLAVEHPQRPGEYVLGVECDGPHYHAAASARDRDRLRGEVLKGLGWRLHRVWSSDWATDREAQVKALDAAVREALEASERPAPVPVPAAPVSVAVPAVEETPPEPVPERDAGRPYEPTELPGVKGGVDFFAPTASARLREQIERVLEQEGPVHEELLARRLLAAWGLQKLTLRVRQRIEEQVAELVKRGAVLERGEFLWSGARRPEQYTDFRRAHPEREAVHLPAEEVANAAAWVLAQALSLGREDLLRATGRLFGVQRLTRAVLPVLQGGLELLVLQGRCVLEDERVVWKD